MYPDLIILIKQYACRMRRKNVINKVLNIVNGIQQNFIDEVKVKPKGSSYIINKYKVLE